MKAPLSGQAVLELAVALLAILLVVVGIVSVGLLSNADMRAMVAAQSEALEKAESGAATSFSPVSDVSAGPDGRFLTPDDVVEHGSSVSARRIAAVVSPGEEGIAAVAHAGTALGSDSLSAVAAGAAAPAFGFRSGTGEEAVSLPPAADPLLGIKPEQTVRESVWFPGSGGLR